MATKDISFDMDQILVPSLPGYNNRIAPCPLGASLTLTRGQAMAQKTSDLKMYPLNTAATDGTQTFGGFLQQSCATDANGLVYFVYGGTAAGPTPWAPPNSYANIYTGGVFSPDKLSTSATGTAVAEVDTTTPTSPTTGDLYSVYVTSGPLAGQGVEVTIGATQTATACVTLLANAWNDDPQLKAYAATSGTATFILTAATAGIPLNLKATAVGTGTVALVQTTAPVQALQAEVDTFTLTTAPSTGDTFTLTSTATNLLTTAAVATVGATQTVAAATVLIAAAWNAVPALAALAVATSTATTVVLTGVTTGTALSVAMTTTSASTTSAKAVTKPALGRSIADILPGAPGAHVLQPSGYWFIP